ncbi:MAG: hypothetical protein IT377_07200 [Polyangiaceae bacterium]|nr:hypothetical protein [Polyangiaceae bacterium]
MAKPVRHGDKWRIGWSDARGQRQSAVFDEFRTAQIELARHQAEAADIRRGRLAQLDPDKTCNELFDYWLDKRALHKRSQKDDVSIIRAHLRPFFGKMRVMDVGTEDADDYINEKDELSPKTIANHVTLLKTMASTS